MFLFKVRNILRYKATKKDASMFACFALALIFVMQMDNVSAQARSKFEQEVAIGFNGGVNMSQVRFLHNSTAYTSKIGSKSVFNHPGVTVGANVLYIAQKHFGVELEVDYTRKGWCEKFKARRGDDVKLIDGVDFNGVVLERDIDYIDIPLLAHIYFGRKARFFVNVGPSFSIMINYKDKTDVTEDQYKVLGDRDGRVNTSLEMSKFDAQICAESGFDLHLDKIHVMLLARWNYGIHDIYPNSKSDLFQRSNTQNLAFLLKVYVPVKKFHSN